MDVNCDSNITLEDINDLKQLLSDLKDKTCDLNKLLKNCIKSVSDNETPYKTEKGFSFLDIKNNVFLSYMSELSYILLRKISKKQIKGESAIKRIIEDRVVLERMRPIECKLKYQIDKLMKLAAGNGPNKEDPLSLKPNLQDFDDQAGDQQEDDESDGDVNAEANTGAYVPPKLMAVPYEDEKQAKALEIAKRRALSSSIVEDLREQYGDAPVEISDSGHRQKKMEMIKKRTKYEEDNLMRMRITKKTRLAGRQQAGGDATLQNLLKFGDYNVDENVRKMGRGKKKFGKKPGKKKHSR